MAVFLPAEKYDLSGPRNVIFISHATPEDDEAAIWLASRLSSIGYEVWVDKEQLLGGEVFWEDIERELWERCIKFIPIVSRISVQKPGVLRELEIANAVQEHFHLKNFITPIVIDSEISNYKDLPRPLPDTNCIGFTNWGKGLERLIKRLEKDGIPKSTVPNVEVLEMLQSILSKEASTHIEKPEILQSNWYEITKLPESVSFFHITDLQDENQIQLKLDNFPWPFVRYDQHIITFAETATVMTLLDLNLELAHQIKINTFLEGNLEAFPEIKAQDAQNIIVNMIRQGWEKYTTSKNLQCHKLANDRKAWWMHKDFIKSDKVYYRRPAAPEKERWCLLVGKSKQYVYHFAIEAKPLLTHIPRLVIHPHIIFTNKGKLPLKKDKMHRLRKSNCKRWFNKEWRDRIHAFMTWLSSGSHELVLPVGTKTSITVSAIPLLMKAPVSVDHEHDVLSDLDDENETSNKASKEDIA